MLDSYLDAEYILTRSQEAVLCIGERRCSGPHGVTDQFVQTLPSAELEEEHYGHLLFEALFPAGGPLRECFRQKLAIAQYANKRLRFRLNILPQLSAAVHDIEWELLYDRQRRHTFARSPDTAFSRFVTVPDEFSTEAVRRPGLLVAVSSPRDHEKYNMAPIDEQGMLRQLDNSLQPLKEYLEYQVLDGPATLERLRGRLREEGFNILHLVGHGAVERGESAFLVLQDRAGNADFVSEDELSELMLGERSLRLITLMSCHGARMSRPDPASGLAANLVRRGIPAVVAMRREISFEAAEHFSTAFYHSLAVTERVDAAVNEARQRLYLRDRKSRSWFLPVLHMRLADGKLWRKREVAKVCRTDDRQPRNVSEVRSGGTYHNEFKGKVNAGRLHISQDSRGQQAAFKNTFNDVEAENVEIDQ